MRRSAVPDVSAASNADVYSNVGFRTFNVLHTTLPARLKVWRSRFHKFICQVQPFTSWVTLFLLFGFVNVVFLTFRLVMQLGYCLNRIHIFCYFYKESPEAILLCLVQYSSATSQDTLEDKVYLLSCLPHESNGGTTQKSLPMGPNFRPHNQTNLSRKHIWNSSDTCASKCKNGHH